MFNLKKTKPKPKLCLIIIVVVFAFLLYKWYSQQIEVTITSQEIDQNKALESYDDYRNAGNYFLYRQGIPEQIYMAENPDLPFSQIETYTSSILLNKDLENVKSIDEIKIGYFDESDFVICYSEQEISIIQEDNDTEVATLYFTNKTGSTSYPDYGNATFSNCENISIIIFMLNENIYCSAVGRNISNKELLAVIQSLSFGADNY